MLPKLSIDSKSIRVENYIDSFTKNLGCYVTSYGEFYALKDYMTNRINFDSYLALYTLSGCGAVIVDGKTTSLEADSFMLLNCKIAHKYFINSDKWHFIFFHFKGSAIEKVTNELCDNGILVLNNQNRRNYMNIFEKVVYDSSTDTVTKALQYNIAINRLLIELRNHVSSKELMSDKQNFILKLGKEYLESNYLKPITLDDLSRELAVSKYYYIRLFKQYYDTTPHNYLMFLRISHAKMLLSQTQCSVEEIAFTCCYESTSSFIRQFKSTLGVSPNSFRNGFANAGSTQNKN